MTLIPDALGAAIAGRDEEIEEALAFFAHIQQPDEVDDDSAVSIPRFEESTN
ncbi:hypothetical protein [Streptomyces sp. AHA2]|uniref:hypothetical protein n=1 Tax=Streptomyces sp. AHA2 TaxID=3064526 RepID=UPI002FDFF226